jgi:hypothetical protein
MTMKEFAGAFLPPDEQAFYDRCVDGLRRAGWSRIDAESEALDRIECRRASQETTQ